MSIRCGHCKGEHETFPEARECSRAWYAARAAPASAPEPEAPAQEAQAAPLEPGLYESGPKVFRLAEDGSWALLSSTGRWMEAARAPYRPERMSVEAVAALGRRHVRCVVCGTALRKPESKARGIGPVCATKV
jgi:hypothetical protein